MRSFSFHPSLGFEAFSRFLPACLIIPVCHEKSLLALPVHRYAGINASLTSFQRQPYRWRLCPPQCQHSQTQCPLFHNLSLASVCQRSSASPISKNHSYLGTGDLTLYAWMSTCPSSTIFSPCFNSSATR